jgi:uncharacterized protein (TIGR02145 family)
MEFLKDTIMDADGNIYHAVKIGDQVWTVENLRTTKYNDGIAIPLKTDRYAWEALKGPGYCWYENDENNGNKYGALYNWFAVNTGKLGPTGWHIPNDQEWDIFEKYLIANGFNWDATSVGNKIAKSLAAKTDWQTCRVPGTVGSDLNENNRSGFSGLPGGFRSAGGNFDFLGYSCGWWSSTAGGPAYGRGLYSEEGKLDRRGSGHKNCGLSVRLVKD